MPRDSPEVSVQSQPWGVSHNTVPGARSQPGSWFGTAVTRVPSALPVPLAELTALGVNVPEALRAAARARISAAALVSWVKLGDVHSFSGPRFPPV